MESEGSTSGLGKNPKEWDPNGKYGWDYTVLRSPQQSYSIGYTYQTSLVNDTRGTIPILPWFPTLKSLEIELLLMAAAVKKYQ